MLGLRGSTFSPCPEKADANCRAPLDHSVFGSCIDTCCRDGGAIVGTKYTRVREGWGGRGRDIGWHCGCRTGQHGRDERGTAGTGEAHGGRAGHAASGNGDTRDGAGGRHRNVSATASREAGCIRAGSGAGRRDRRAGAGEAHGGRAGHAASGNGAASREAEVAQATPLQATEIRETVPVAVTATSPQRPREKVAASAPVPAPAVETVDPEPVKPAGAVSISVQPVEQPSPAGLVEVVPPKTGVEVVARDLAIAEPQIPNPASALEPEVPEAEIALGAGPSTIGNGNVPGAWSDYVAVLQVWLKKHREYPESALLLRQEGTASVYFVINRDGSLRDYRIEKSSGHELLDRAVIGMIERAQPLPQIPGNLDGTQVVLVVPVQFVLR